MLSQNFQFVWAFIAAKQQNTIEVLPPELEESSDFSGITPRVVSKQEDDYFFSAEAVQNMEERSLTNRPPLMSLDSSINFDVLDEDAYMAEQTKLIESLMRIQAWALG